MPFLPLNLNKNRITNKNYITLHLKIHYIFTKILIKMIRYKNKIQIHFKLKTDTNKTLINITKYYSKQISLSFC